MLVILSPAKTMDMSPFGRTLPATAPRWNAEAELIASKMARYTVEELAYLLGISPRLAEENFERFRYFDESDTPSKQAILAYSGSVFRRIDPAILSGEDLLYTQDHVRIVSELYGLLRPLDRIKAYRIAYKLRLAGMPGNLYDYWVPRLTGPLIEDVRAAGGILVNLASKDVMPALESDRLAREVRVITVDFREHRDGRYETVRTYAKMCRGEMTRSIIQKRIESPDELQCFSWDGFVFDEALSDEDRYVFSREKKADGKR